MQREDWRDLEAERLRRLSDRDRDRNDYGQADYSNLYGYDPRTRSGYRAYDDGRAPEPRRYDAYDRDDHRRIDARDRRSGPSDRVLWAVIMERLELKS